MILDSYVKYGRGYVTLSGESEGAEQVATDLIATISGGKAKVKFLPTAELDKKKISDKFGVDYVENPEGFVVVAEDDVKIYADTKLARLYGANSVKYNYKNKLRKGVYYGYPSVAHRSVRIDVPSKSNIPFFKSHIDMLIHLGYNAVIIEVAAILEFKKHPEINEKWIEYAESMAEYNEKPLRATDTYYIPKDSIHSYNALGDIYTHDEMRELVKYCKERGLDVIPEVPSLSHSEWFLISHPELRECDDEPYASAACPSNPALYELLFDIYDEVIEVFEPTTIHIGHDEWYAMCRCDKCRDKDASKLFAEDIIKCYNYLKERGIKTMMWADKALALQTKSGEAIGGSEKHFYSIVQPDFTRNVMGVDYPTYKYYICDPEEELPEGAIYFKIHYTAGCIDLLPKDITMVHWHWTYETRLNSLFLQKGYDMILGNCFPENITNYKQRFGYGTKGFCISNWRTTTEEGSQIWGTQFSIGYGTVITWHHEREESEFMRNVRDAFDALYYYRNYETLRGKHLKVTHTLVGDWAVERATRLRKPITIKDEYTIGHYCVEYKDGRVERFPVQYWLNIGFADAKRERWACTATWSYTTDRGLTVPSSVSNLKMIGNKNYYETVFPLSGDVSKVTYVPSTEKGNLVDVKSMKIEDPIF